MSPTTRRFARTTLEAWPTRSPGSVSGPYRAGIGPAGRFVLAVALVLCAAAIGSALSIWSRM